MRKTVLSRTSKPKLLTTTYAKDVLAGRIKTGKKVKQACQRHLDDLERSKAKDFPYRFDPKKALRPIRFTEQFCKPSQGGFDRMVLHPWDHFWIGSLFGWVHKKTGLRRFRQGLIFVARKQGKSVKLSALANYGASKDGERGAFVYLLANSMKQARVVFDECRAMIKSSPSLNKFFRPLRDAIYFDATNSKIEPQAADSEKLDGLNCHFGVFDEIHEYKNYKLINVIKNSTSARKQPLVVYITTAGYQLDGPLMDYYERGVDVLNGIIQDDRSFYYIAELDEDDDIEDPSNWIKANPNMGISVQLEDMIEDWEARKRIPAERNDFITKRLNLFVHSGEQSFIDLEVIRRNNGYLDLSELAGRDCIGGFDLSSSEDFTSVCLEFPLEDNKVFVLSHSFVPERKVFLDQENLPFRDWEKEGLLTICKGDYVDFQDVYDWFVKQAELYSILKITYDPANAFRLVRELQLYGGEEWTKLVRQGAITLSPALKDIKEMLLDGRVIFNQNKLLKWYINNVRLVDDRNGNWLPSKQGIYRKIDGFAAWLNAHTETMKFMVLDSSGEESSGVPFISIKDLRKGVNN